jgi:hypothetical protein
MTTTRDHLLRERARLNKAHGAAPRLNRVTAVAGKSVGEVWSQMQKETARQAAVYCNAFGDRRELVVETPADEIRLRARDGRESIVRIDRKTGRLSEIYKNQGGGIRVRTPAAKIVLHSSGDIVWNFGLQPTARSLIRRLIG